ncbi:Spo7-like protein-domain-containing protein [Elsinoe ampelina]|uniref:Spo7-like protein-domain-containing protein n=1 Tax=Elsinoe ampelina TaxID=302913 RepID=A0A6A6GHA0_9PEZI|nr:Spo7-like protein-domain-containing protein [Elsinoe ampelina]
MSSNTLDRIVKGAPPPNVSPEQVATAARKSSTSQTSVTAPQPPPLDPVSHLPSSPPQIYLNLLILESSLRAQYLSLRARLRLHILLLGALLVWTLTFTYLLFLRPREDGQGTGGSVYWVVDVMEKMGFVGGMVTWGLVWGTGLWDRGVRWPRRWVGITNRGLRGFNLKVVVIRGSWWKEVVGYLGLLGPFGYWAGTKGMRYEYLPRDIERTPGDKQKLQRLEGLKNDLWIEEDVASGGDTIKLLLLPKPFSPDFREEWDTYRTSYWEKENERRSGLRKMIKIRDREIAKKEGGLLWWTGWRGWQNLVGKSRVVQDQKAKVVREKPSSTQIRREKRKDGLLSDGNSRSSSRSSTPTPEPEGRNRRGSEVTRRTSSQSTARRKKAPGALSGVDGRPSPRIPSDSSRPSTPDGARGSELAAPARTVSKRSSNLSISSVSDSEVKKEETPPTDVEVKSEKG